MKTILDLDRNVENQNKFKKLTEEKINLEKKIEIMETKINELTILNEKLEQELISSNNINEKLKETNIKTNELLNETLAKNESLLDRNIMLTKTKQELIEDYDKKINQLSIPKKEFDEQIELKNNQIKKLTILTKKQKNQINRLTTLTNKQKDQINRTQKTLKNQVKQQDQIINEYESSNSWKITKPLRKMNVIRNTNSKNNAEE